MDQGKNRTVADIVGIEGHEHPKRLATVATFIMLFDSQKYSDAANHGRRKSFYTIADVASFVSKNKTALEESIEIGFSKENKQIVGPSFLAGMHFLFARKNPKAADDFADKLIMGENINRKHPIYHLREAIMRDMKSSKNKFTKYYRLGICIKAWNAYRKGQEMTILKFDAKNEQLPIIS